MTEDELVKLAERAEAASGPDRELDREIAVAVGHPWDYAADWGSRGHERPVAFPYTASIDAAMMLVPPAYRLTSLAEYDTSMGEQLAGRWTVGLVPREHSHLKTYEQRVSAMGRAEAATPALALCAAALRATTTGEAK